MKTVIEGIIMAAEGPVTVDDLQKILQANNSLLENKEIKDLINELVNDYSGHGIELKEVASGWRFQVRQDLTPWISKLWEERPPRYSRAFLETLALIAYRQPITRAEIEEVRGVTVSSNIVKTLVEHDWVKVAGYKEVPGRPALYVTTKKFLDYFNLKSLQDLPPLIEFTNQEVAEENLQNIGITQAPAAEAEEHEEYIQTHPEVNSDDEINSDLALDSAAESIDAEPVNLAREEDTIINDEE